MILSNVDNDTYKSVGINETYRFKLENGYHNTPTHNYRMQIYIVEVIR